MSANALGRGAGAVSALWWVVFTGLLGCGEQIPHPTGVSSRDAVAGVPRCGAICPAAPGTTSCVSDNDGSQVSCEQFACDSVCTYASLPGDVCVDSRRDATSTCGNVGVSQVASQCLLDPTHPGCRPLDRAGSTAYATCNDGSSFPVIDLGLRSFSQLSGPQTKQGTERNSINQLMNNAAAAMGCVYDVDANPILESGEADDRGKDDGEDDDEPPSPSNPTPSEPRGRPPSGNGHGRGKPRGGSCPPRGQGREEAPEERRGRVEEMVRVPERPGPRLRSRLLSSDARVRVPDGERVVASP